MKFPVGVFCLEGHSPFPVNALATLQVLQRNCGVAFDYQGPVTIEQFWRELDRWVKREANLFPILFLAFHGASGAVTIGDECVFLDEIAERIAGRGRGRWLHISACSTLCVPPNFVADFLQETRLEGVSGYDFDVPIVDAFLEDYLTLRDLILGSSQSKTKVTYEVKRNKSPRRRSPVNSSKAILFPK